MKSKIKIIFAVLLIVMSLMVAVCASAEGEKPYTKTTYSDYSNSVEKITCYTTMYYNVPIGSLTVFAQYDRQGSLINVMMREYKGNSEQFVSSANGVVKNYVMVFEKDNNLKPITQKEIIRIEYDVPGGTAIDITLVESSGTLVGTWEDDTTLYENHINIDGTIYQLDSYIEGISLKDYLGTSIQFKWYEKNGINYVIAIKKSDEDDTSDIRVFDAKTNFFVVDSVVATTYDSEEARMIRYYTEGTNELLSAFFTEKSVNLLDANVKEYESLSKGSVLEANVTDDGLVISYAVISNAENGKYNLSGDLSALTTSIYGIDALGSAKGDKAELIYGYITDIDGKILTVGGTADKNFADGRKFTISARTAQYGYNANIPKHRVVVGEYLSTYVDVYDGGSANRVFLKVYDNEVIDIISLSKRETVTNPSTLAETHWNVNVDSDIIIPDIPYGYLIDYVSNNDMSNSAITVRFIDKSGKVVTYDLKSKVRINGVSYEAVDAISVLAASSARIHANKAVGYGAFPAENPGNSPVSQVIRYKMGTEDGKTVVEELFTVGSASASSYESETGAIIPHWTETDGTNAPFISCYNKLTCSGSSTTKMFRNSYGSIEFSVNNKTVVFKIPGGPGVEKDAEKCKRSIGSYSFSDKTSYYVEAYDVDGTTAQVVVYYLTGSGGTKIYANTSTYMVVNITTTTNNGKSVHELEYVKLGENIFDPADGVTKVTKKVFAEDTTQLAGLKKGDVIKFVTASGEIEKVEKLFIFDEKKLYGKTGDDGDVAVETDNYFAHKKGSDDEYFQARFGKVYELSVDDAGKGSIAIYVEGWQDGFDQIYTLTENTKYYTLDDRGNVVDTGYGAITEGTKSDYASASEVLVIAYDEKTTAIYVIPQY